jgi:DNA-binding response OmpR family regulator
MPTRVLLADDDVELATMLCEYLEREGFRMTVGTTVKQPYVRRSAASTTSSCST